MGKGVTAGWGLARLFISLTFLMPIGGNDKEDSSFCVIQGILVVCAQTGIGLANKTWDAAMSNFTDLMQDNDGAAEAAAEEILQIDARSSVERMIATGICVGVGNRYKGYLGDLDKHNDDLDRINVMGAAPIPKSVRENKNIHPLHCGGVPGNEADQKWLEGLAKAYPDSGVRLRDSINGIYAERTAILEGVRDIATSWLVQPHGWTVPDNLPELPQARRMQTKTEEKSEEDLLRDAIAEAEKVNAPFFEAVNGVSKSTLSLIDSRPEIELVDTSRAALSLIDSPPGTELPNAFKAVRRAVSPAMTQNLWWLGTNITGSYKATTAYGACIAYWGKKGSDGSMLAGPVAQDNEEGDYGLISTSIFHSKRGLRASERVEYWQPRTYWPLIAFMRGAMLVPPELTEACATSVKRIKGNPSLKGSDFTTTNFHDYKGSLYFDAVASIQQPNAEFVENLKPLIQNLYQDQLEPLWGHIDDDPGAGDFVGDGRRGWLLAGGVYWHIQVARRVNNVLRKTATPEVVGPRLNTSACQKGGEGCWEAHAWNTGHMLAQSVGNMGRLSAPNLVYDPADFNTWQAFNLAQIEDKHFDDAVARWMIKELYAVGEDNAPLSRMMNAGIKLLEYGFWVYGIGTLIEFIPGMNTVKTTGMKTVGSTMLLCGFLLAVWLPSLPLIAWISSAWAWLVSVVLGLLAAPLWALAHGIPDGHGPLSGYSRRGYELLMFTTVRPMLLVAGLLLAMTMSGLICKVAAVLFSAMLGGYAASTLVEGAGWGIDTLLVMMMSVVLFIFIAWLVTKTFTLCHELPDKVFEWVGQGVQSLGDQDMLQGGRSFVGGIFSQGQGKLGGMMRRSPKAPGAGQVKEVMTTAAKAGQKGGRAPGPRPGR